jgi:heptosyltransferase II
VHNRWKTPEPAFLLHSHKRGILIPDGVKPKPFRVILRSPNWLGDACMALPAVRAIKRGRPDLELTILAPSKLGDMWRAVPEVDAVLGRDGKESVLSVAAKIRAAGPFDVGILLPNSPRVAMEMAFGGVHRIIGYAARWRKLFLHQIIPPKEEIGPPRHHVEYYLQIAHKVGADCTTRDLFDPLPRPDNPNSSSSGPIRLGLCAGAEYGPAKRWPLDKFAAMATMISDARGAEIEWVLFGAPGEKALGQELEKLGGNCRNLVGKTSLEGLIGELRTCRLLVSNDTGTMHLAAMLGVPVIAIFGSTEPAWTRPLGKQHVILREHVECSPCFLRQCPLDLRCMHAITPEKVAAAVENMLGA